MELCRSMHVVPLSVVDACTFPLASCNRAVCACRVRCTSLHLPVQAGGGTRTFFCATTYRSQWIVHTFERCGQASIDAAAIASDAILCTFLLCSQSLVTRVTEDPFLSSHSVCADLKRNFPRSSFFALLLLCFTRPR